MKNVFVSISGDAGAGKSTLSDIITTHYTKQGISVSPFSFANPLKDALCLWFNWDRERLNSDFNYKEGGLGNKLPDDIDPYCTALGMTRREIMQRFGTECMRDGLHNDFWVIMARLGLQRGVIPVSTISIIGDARFSNELQWVKSEGGLNVRVNRISDHGSTLTTHTGHSSESEWKNWSDWDFVIENPIYEDRSVQYGLAVFENRAQILLERIDEMLVTR